MIGQDDDDNKVCVCVPGEVHGCISLRFVRSQCVVDVPQVVYIREFRYSTGQHLQDLIKEANV